MWQQSADPRRFGVGGSLLGSFSKAGRGRVRGFACAALLLLSGLSATPAAAQSATTVTITGARQPTFARVDQVITFNVKLYTGNTAIDSLTFTSGSPAGMSGLSCPGLPADLMTTTNCTFTYTVQPMDMAMGTITALGRWRATRPTGAARSGSTNTLVLTYAPPREPDAPVIGTATAGNTQATVAFTEADFDGGWPVDGYTVTSSPGGVTANGTASPITVSGLTNGVAYRFTVSAANVIGTSTLSGQSNAVTPKAPQTITFTNPGAQDFGTAPTLTATASSGLPVSFSSASTTVCTATSGGAVTFIAAGTCTIDAHQAGSAAFNAAPQVTQSFTVNAVAPGAPVIGAATAGDAQAAVTFTPPASTGGTALTGYTVTSSPGGLSATGSASPITLAGLSNGTAYTFTVTATNSAGTGAASAASNAVTPKASQTLTFANPGAQNFGTSPTLTATSSTGLTVTFSSSTTGVCTITAGGALTFVSGGTCTIDADQPGDAATQAAATVTQSFAVNAVAPGAPVIGSATGGDGSATITFSAPASNGGAAITGYTVTSQPGGLTATGAGSPITLSGLTNGVAYAFTVTATTSAGTGAASAASNAVTPKANQTITFANPGAQMFGTSPTLTATSTSGLTVSFSSSTPGVCSITSGGALTFGAAGTCTIDADQAGTPAYLPATRVSRSFTVDAVVPTAPTSVTAIGGNAQAAVSFVPPASDGGAAITGYTVTSSPGNVQATGTASPIQVSGLSNGTTYTFTVTAGNSAGNSVASTASNAVTPIASQTITFANPGTQSFGTSPTLTATSSAGLPVSFGSSTTGVCTITAGGVLTFVSAGTCTIDADQPGDAVTAAAATVTQSFAVNAVAAAAPVIGTATAGDGSATITFIAPASNGGAVITGYTVTSLPGGLTATGVGSPITITGLTNGVAYSFTVTATTSAGSGATSAASNAVTPAANQTITFANPGAQDFGTSPTLAATSDSGLPVTLTSATPGVCAVSSSGVLTFVAVGTCTIDADQSGSAAVLPAARVSRSFTVNAVVPRAPTSVTAVGADAQATVTFAAPASDGGAAITGYTVTSIPGGITASGAASPILVSGLTNGTSYAFTVAATNSAGTGNASVASNVVMPAPPLAVAAVNATVPYAAAATPVTLAITGTATSVAIGTPPSHGTAVASGTTISYQPAAGYAGADSFTYTASDGITTTSAATVSITVSNASVSLDAATLANGTGGTAYSHALTATGGAAPYTFALAGGTLPDGITLSPSGVLSGTPTEAGTFNFTVQATDSSTGTGPFVSQHAYTLVVDVPQIALTADTWPPATFGVALTQTLQSTGGTAPYKYTITAGALPQGVALSNEGVLSGTPGATGTFSATVEVRDANGFTATNVFELVVAQAAQAITAFASNPVAPVFVRNGTFEVSAQGGASGNPVVFASTASTVCTVTGATVTMHAAGRCSLTADQAGDTRFGAAAQVRLDVDIAAAVPVLTWPAQLSKVLGEPAFELTNPRSPSAGGFTFTSSQPDVATVSGRTVTLHGGGTTVITATQAASGNYAAASIQMQLEVTARPDPTRDPSVTGLLQAQVDASVRFARAQQSNIRDRLRQVRSGDNASSTHLTLANEGGPYSQGSSIPLGSDAAAPAMPKGWGLWSSGTATFGSTGQASGFDFRTDGITVGVDRAIGGDLLVGVAGSMARNDSDLDDDASHLDASQRSLALYGLWRAGDHVFLDGVLGAGRLNFDMRRWSDDAGAVGMATRDGDQWFGSLSLGYEHRGPALTLTGYARADASRSSLDGYRETGLGIYDLAYRRQAVDNRTVALGLEGSWLVGGADGRLRPFWTVEYREAVGNRGEARMNYVLWPNATDYRLRMSSYNDNALSLSAGFDLGLSRGWLMSLLLGYEQASGATSDTSIGLRITYGSPAPAAATAVQMQPGAAPAGAVCNGPRCGKNAVH
ncbi:fibronectin type III domain-containing protein [Frateuria hangzhouensis]|uniref:fibronectin type III domain-containing protein n=1 Tax=Frateuria hangzhouensis TaxID=2995589 RepID=UPI00226097F2|nr:autotransporter domain-containing protein [Frateuria sp. STR12]MCX7512933.1 fibronectin type III domain-containing protein [Frateuria sp. STR12]